MQYHLLRMILFCIIFICRIFVLVLFFVVFHRKNCILLELYIMKKWRYWYGSACR